MQAMNRMKIFKKNPKTKNQKTSGKHFIIFFIECIFSGLFCLFRRFRCVRVSNFYRVNFPGAILLFICMAITNSAFASSSVNSIDSFQITADTLQALPSCLHYRVVGVCFWLDCGVTGCSVVTTPKVQHYLPDLVVSVYPRYGKDPWWLVNQSLDKVDHVAGQALFDKTDGFKLGSGNISTTNNHDGDLAFREVDVIGNPALAAIHLPVLLLTGQAQPMLPYYQSQLDAYFWRSGFLGLLNPYAWIPGYKVVGTFLVNDWGDTYPRSGFVLQDNPMKAAAVIAVRAANIATTENLHLHQNLNSTPCPEKACTTAGPIFSKTKKVEWQRLMPNKQTVCQANLVSGESPAWTQNKKTNQNAMWVVWREYRGCINGPGTFIGSS